MKHEGMLSETSHQGRASELPFRCTLRPVASCVMTLMLLFCLASSSWASNPIVNTAYSADPSAHVFQGKMYVYASHDRVDAKNWNMVGYHAYSTDDMQNWRDHGIALRISDVHWASRDLWAPDCAVWKGRYYLFFPARDESGKFRII
jgi:hypothetical protein